MSKVQQQTIKELRAEIKELKKALRPKTRPARSLYNGVKPGGSKELDELFEIVNSAVVRGVIKQESWWDVLTYLDFKHNNSKFTTPGSTEFKKQS
jgi:hypothetical protein